MVLFILNCGAHDLAPAQALQPQTFHQSLDQIAGHLRTFSVHLLPHLVGFVDLPVGLPDGLDLG